MENETCYLNQCCINCKEASYDSTNHTPLDKQCPIFLKEKEIEAIVTLEKKDKKEAIRTYQARHPQINCTTLSTVIKNAQIAHNEPNTNRVLAKYDDLPPIPHITHEFPTPTHTTDRVTTRSTSTKENTKNKNVLILPKNTSKKMRLALGKANKNKSISDNSNEFNSAMDTSDSSIADLDSSIK